MLSNFVQQPILSILSILLLLSFDQFFDLVQLSQGRVLSKLY
jgi:hypothetical protein